MGSTQEELLAAGSGLFEIGRIYLSKKEHLLHTDPCAGMTIPILARQEKCDRVDLALPPGAAPLVESPLEGFTDLLLKLVAANLATSRGESSLLKVMHGEEFEIPASKQQEAKQEAKT